MQERISGWIHEEERRTSLLELEPTPEVHVGSLQQALSHESGFERISDSEEVAEQKPEAAPEADHFLPADVADAAAPATADPTESDLSDGFVDAEKYQAVTELLADWQAGAIDESPVVASPEPDSEPLAGSYGEQGHDKQGLTHHVVEVGDDVEVLHLNPPTIEFAEAIEVGDTQEPESSEAEEESTEEEAPKELKDASAKVRQRSRKGEMATRRGGRGRKRTFRQRGGANDATSDAEDDDDQDEVIAPPPAVLPPPPLAPLPPRQIADRFQRPVISDLLREGQEIIVQIAKEPIGQKGARITSHVALPGRYIVYMPTVDHIGVSRKIGTDEERQRLRRTLQQLRAETGAGGGFIVRTAANGCPTEDLREDIQYLVRTWSDIRRRSEKAKSPAIVHRDLDLVQRILRDQISSDFTAIRVDNEFEYERIVDFVNRFAPKLVHRVKLYTKDTPILENYGVQPEIDKAVKPRVWLKSGGYIVINQTEALVAIDVNTGKFVGKSNRLEDTIVKTNLEAAKEIVRQIRLRDLGGIIVLDLIDMEERRNRAKVMQVLEQELRNDRSPSKVLQFNDFGLVAVTRKRVKQSLERTLCTPCAYCGGGGMVKSAQTICYEILAEARRISKDVEDHNEIILRINPEVVKALRGSERDVLIEIEAYLGGVVTIKSDPTVHQEQFDIALA
jgi:ribonuclease G